MSVSDFVVEKVRRLLASDRVVVWYDPRREFEGLLPALKDGGTRLVDARRSIFVARRDAEDVYRSLCEPTSPSADKRLLVYVPLARGVGFEQRREDPFEAFAVVGAAFGDKPDHALGSLAKQAMPDLAPEIERLLAEGDRTLGFLDALRSGHSYPTLRSVFGSESGVDCAALALGDDAKAKELASTPGALDELRRAAATEIGFHPSTITVGVQGFLDELAAYVLLSELAHDLPGGMPDALGAVRVAEDRYRVAVARVCERMRNDLALRDRYMERATAIERSYHLTEVFAGATEMGRVDTFAFEDDLRLRTVARSAIADDLCAAHSSLDGTKGSLWRDQPERRLRWQVAAHCVEFLEKAREVGASWKAGAESPSSMIRAYTDDSGWWRVDRLQRLFEQAATKVDEAGELEPLLDLCRARYYELASAMQERLLAKVGETGWPPTGVERQEGFFSRYVQPLLDGNERVAWFVVDSLRYEMGRDLLEGLLGETNVRIDGLATILPTSTPFCMAALMPKAEGALNVRNVSGSAVPCLGERPLPDLDKRKAYLTESFGDRFHAMRLDKVRSAKDGELRSLGRVGLLMVYTDDPDKLAEQFDPSLAHRTMSEVVGQIASVARRLASFGFTQAVVVADHGHILLPELPPGGVQEKPKGEWTLQKRRSLLGRSTSSPGGVAVLPASKVGIRGDVAEIALPKGLRAFQAGAAYFHEGLSLQECVVPVVSFRLRAVEAGAGKPRIGLTYKSGTFRTLGFQLKMRNESLADEHRVVVAVVDPKTGAPAGDVIEFDERDDRTGEVTLGPAVELSVPVVVRADAGERIEVRVLDPQTGIVHAKLELKNGVME